MTKRLPPILLVLAISACAATPRDRFQSIDAEVLAIRQALGSMDSVAAEVDGQSAEGGEATAYRDSQGWIRLINGQWYGHSGQAARDFFYRNNVLIFVHAEHTEYNAPLGMDAEGAKELGIEPFDIDKSKVTEERMYLHGGRLIRWIDERGRQVAPDRAAFKKCESDLLEMSKDLMARFD